MVKSLTHRKGEFDMKATGIVRRIDDLGRIVIPKVLREQLKLKDGEPMEFFYDETSILIRKYNTNITPLDKLKEFIDKYSGDLPEGAVNNLLKAYDLIEAAGEFEDEEE